ncbi:MULTISPECIES: AI-2E family transporter [unclassified Flavobacterium]|uniref:AI-2E family transporter n=1 Tax=unclassified Flavobacterium TaxID=196869 RepID=UPI000F87849D|nr:MULTISPECIES: AI-2E family transporter [unclassified Flavobacterium]RTY92152.1 AI-2E family transporter [Flavobacterium sp. RSP46]RTZ05850.1 AI-2E family transporter [Flavobacterium sp. GSP6]
MNDLLKFPFYAKLTLVLLSLIAIIFIFYIGQDILVPIMMSFLFAILLYPIVQFLKSKLYFPHVLAVMLAVLLFVLLFLGLFVFLSFQISDFADDFDKIERNITIHISNIQRFLSEHFNLSSWEQKQYLDTATEDSMEKGKEIIGTTLLSFTDTLLNLTLIPIYTFLILLYRTHFLLFLSKLFKKENHEQLKNILTNIRVAINSYIVGLIIETILVSVMTTVGFIIIGVKYAVLLGVVTGILNLIPYIGILFAGILSIIASLTGTPDLSIIIGIIVVTIFVQLIDNNILVPIIVSSKVEINAFISIIGIIIGGAIAGIAGMFLALPIIAVLKVIFDRIESLEPWGYLMGDHLPKTYTWHSIKLPLFDSDASSKKTIIKTDLIVPVFTETTTENNTENKAETDLNKTSESI